MPTDSSIAVVASLSEEGLKFLRAPGRFAVIATVDPDGAPRQAVIWYRLDGATIVINSAAGRRWPTNLQRDPRLSFVVAEGGDWLGIQGTVQAIEDQEIAQADIAAMAIAYDGPAEAARSIARFRTEHRISFRISPAQVHEEFEG